MPSIYLRQDLGNTEPRSANVVVKNSGLSNLELDNNFNNINNSIEQNSGNVWILFDRVSDSYDQANTGTSIAQNAYTQANIAYNQANTGTSIAQNAYTQANIAYNQANTGTSIAQNAYAQANTGTSIAQNAYTQANTGTTIAQNAYDNSNTKFNISGGNITGQVTISSSLTVTGNLTVSGNVTTVSANNLILEDNMIYLNDGSIIANPDLGISGNYNDGTYRHAGFFRDASDGIWKVYDQYIPEPDASPYIDTSNSSFRIADFQANNVTFGKITTSSNQLVSNLNADLLDGQHSSYYTDASNLSSGTIPVARLSNIPNSSLSNTSITINGTPIALGSSGTIVAGATITDDITTNATRYIMLGTATSGAYTIANTSSTKLYFNPSTGILTATSFSGNGSSITNLNASNLSSGTVPTARLGTGTASSTTYLAGDNTWKTISGGATITNDTTTNATRYVILSDATSGSMSTANTSSTKLYFNPSTGTLSATVFNSLSDKTQKENISEIKNASYILNNISGYEFNWKDNGSKSSGVIAQEIENVLPHLVSENDGIKSVNYSGLIAYLIEAIKYQQIEINDLKNKINN